jgi:hypothetical protein
MKAKIKIKDKEAKIQFNKPEDLCLFLAERYFNMLRTLDYKENLKINNVILYNSFLDEVDSLNFNITITFTDLKYENC